VLDQSNPRRAQPCNARGWAPDDPSSWAAQTFTAGRSGTLTDVVLPLRGGTDQITVAVAPVDGGGMPIVASPLASTTLPFAKPSTYTPIDFLFPTPAQLTAGKQYAIVVSSSTESTATYVAWEGDIGSTYGDSTGARCADGAYGGGRAWTQGSDPLGANADFFFETYVVPAPAPPAAPPAPTPPKKPAAATISTVNVRSVPAVPTAGAAFRLVTSITLSTGRRVSPTSARCAARLAGVQLRGSGSGGCTFRIPKSAGGKRLAITVVATYRGKTKSRVVAYTIRPAPAGPKPKPTPQPTAGGAVISTPAGRLAVDGVDLTDRFPPGCVQASVSCDVAQSGYRILVIWLKIVSGNPGAVLNQLTDTKAVVVASDGSRTAPYSGGLLNGRLFLAFTPRSSSHGFKLLWPGNAPIPLGK
jgi:hypothetical protein